MGLFCWIGYDGPKGKELRKLHRQEHLDGLNSLEEAGRIRHAGPLLDPEGEPCGSMILFEANSLEEAQHIAAGDAYAKRGIFERFEVFETRVVFPRKA